MATEGFVHRLPPPSGAPLPQPSSGTAQSVLQESGSVPPPPPSFSRPVFYMPAPPPPPPHLLHQWPMSYFHPFMGFPGSGYGMVMPPFLPPPYLDPSAYILPHLQPVDYRRMHHHPVNAPVPSQQPQNQQHRPRPPPVRETISIEVQTDPMQRLEGGFDDGRSDSGHGTASNASSPSSSSSKKGGSEQVKGSTPHCNAESSQIPEQCLTNPVQSFLNAAQAMQQRRNAAGHEPALGQAHYNMWSESSPDGIVPVLSSSQREDEIVERRRSVPDILMLKIPDEVQTQNPQLYDTGTECEKSVFPGLDTKHDSVVEEISRIHDDAMLFKILRFPFSLEMFRRDSQSFSYNPDEFLLSRDECHEPETDSTMNDTADFRRHHVTSLRHRRSKKLNESIWSVESLEPYVMNREWLLQNNLLEQPIIVDDEAVEGDAELLAKLCGDTPRGYRDRCSDTTMRRIDFSTPEGKRSSPKKQNQSEKDEGKLKGKDGPEEGGSPILLQDKCPTTPDNKEIHENGSSEATRNLIQQEKCPQTFPLDPDPQITPKRVTTLQRAAGADDVKDVPPENQDLPDAPRMADKGTEPLKSLDYAIQCDLCVCARHRIDIELEGPSRCSGQKGITTGECRIQGGLPRNGRKSKKENNRNRNQSNQCVNGRSRQ